MIEALDSAPAFAVAGPSGHCGARPQNTGSKGMSPGVAVVNMLSFFCAVFKRSVFEQVGFLDDEYHHWGCDSDYCQQVRQAGLQLIWVRDVYIEHDRVPHSERPAELMKLKGQDKARYRRKWRSKKRKGG